MQEITANNEVVVNGFWHKCTGNETFLHYSEEPSCIANGKEIHYGETFRQGTFEMRCENWGLEIVG